MKHRRFRLLFAAMLIALTGMIALQVYWLANALTLEKKKYAEQVRIALEKATAKLETREVYTQITNSIIPSLHDTILQDCTIVMSPGKNMRVIDRKLPPPIHADTTGPDIMLKMVDDDSVEQAGDSTRLVIEQRFRNAVKSVWIKYVRGDGDRHERISGKQIDTALSTCLADAGISGAFAFGVERKDGFFPVISDSTKKTELAASGFRTTLFPGDVNPSGDELVVTINGHHLQVLLALLPQFLLSFLLTLFLVIVFYTTFREALKQKKIGEIRNDFINNMTHEFKTPIATISLAADTVMNEAVIKDPEKVREYASVIKRENQRMNDQVEKVLELALTEKEKPELRREPVDVCELLVRVMNTMKLQVEARNGTLTYEAGITSFRMNGDEFHLERVFTNLLDNALKYSGENPAISIKTTPHKDGIRIEFTDKGIGISEEEQQRIFDRFYRVPTGDLHNVKGFGLGLSYVKTIVEKHGGSVQVQSRPGTGSTFIICFTS